MDRHTQTEIYDISRTETKSNVERFIVRHGIFQQDTGDTEPIPSQGIGNNHTVVTLFLIITLKEFYSGNTRKRFDYCIDTGGNPNIH